MAILMFGEPGVDILYPDPGFPIYRSMIEFTGARPVPIPVREENGFAFSAEETLALMTPRTRLHHPEFARQSDRRRHAESEIDTLVDRPRRISRRGDPVGRNLRADDL